MTTIVTSTDIPSNINTLERLLMHVVLAAKATIGASTFNLDGSPTGSRTPFITTRQGDAVGGDEQLYFQAFIYLPLDNKIENNQLNQRPWMYANEISNNVYPAGYRLT